MDRQKDRQTPVKHYAPPIFQCMGIKIYFGDEEFNVTNNMIYFVETVENKVGRQECSFSNVLKSILFLCH